MRLHQNLFIGMMALMAACRTPPARAARPLAAVPIESIALRLLAPVDDARALIRTILYQNGYQVHAESRSEGWYRTNIGGVWEDRARYRQWHIVVQYADEGSGTITDVRLRAIEQSTWFTVHTIRVRGTPELSDGFTRVTTVTDVTPGEAADAWRKLEQLAFKFTDHGAELLTDFGTRQQRP